MIGGDGSSRSTKTIRVFEHGSLYLGRHLSEAQFEALVRFGDKHRRYFSVGHRRIHFSSYVGFLQVGRLGITRCTIEVPRAPQTRRPMFTTFTTCGPTRRRRAARAVALTAVLLACNARTSTGTGDDNSESTEGSTSGTELPDDLSGWVGEWTMTPSELPVGEPIGADGFANFEVLSIGPDSIHVSTDICGAYFVPLDVVFDLVRDEPSDRLYLVPQSENYLVGEGERFEQAWLELGEPCDSIKIVGLEDGQETEWATWHRQALCRQYCDENGTFVTTLLEACEQEACGP